RLDAHHARPFLHRAGLQAGDFRVTSPGLALREVGQRAAASRERDKDERADEIQTNPRHLRKIRRSSLRTVQGCRLTAPEQPVRGSNDAGWFAMRRLGKLLEA